MNARELLFLDFSIPPRILPKAVERGNESVVTGYIDVYRR